MKVNKDCTTRIEFKAIDYYGRERNYTLFIKTTTEYLTVSLELYSGSSMLGSLEYCHTYQINDSLIAERIVEDLAMVETDGNIPSLADYLRVLDEIVSS
jgi:hypothetical protein